MAKLRNLNTHSQLASNVEVAESFYARLKGLLGRRSLADGQVLWIKRCNSIHTWFMKFPIDVVFVDDQLFVKATYTDLQPWKLTFPAWRARSVFEFPAGTLKNRPVNIGDQLHVGD